MAYGQAFSSIMKVISEKKYLKPDIHTLAANRRCQISEKDKGYILFSFFKYLTSLFVIISHYV
jgi:hypothetical protein